MIDLTRNEMESVDTQKKYTKASSGAQSLLK